MVMAVHFVGDATPYTWGERLAVKLGGYGVLGVDLFFVLSGFLITGLLLDSKDSPHYFRNFYARRTLRIFPLYYTVLAVLFVVLPRVATLPPPLEEARRHQAFLWTYTANFFIAAKASWALTYVSHFWSLAIEEHFYLVWPLVVFSVRRETLERICLGVIGAALVLRIALSLAGVSELSISVLTPCRLDTLCVGALLAAVARRAEGPGRLLQRSGPAALVLGGASIALAGWCAITHIGLPVIHPIRGTLYALFFGALTLMSVQSAQRNLIARAFQASWLRTFGKYSYGLYVYHGLFSYHMQELHTDERLGAMLGSHSLGIAAQTVVGVGISLLVSVLSYELFERPFLGLKRFFEARPAPAPRPAVSSVGEAGKARSGMPEPLVSVIINNYNYDRYLARSIESALAQTYRRTEVIAVDDGSTDGSRNVIRSYQRVVPVFKDANGGQGSALNAGFRASHGEIVIFLDADDYLEPGAVARVVSAWRPGTAKAQYRLAMVDATGDIVDLFPPRDTRFDSGDVVPLLLRRGRYQTAVMSGNAFAREVLERILPMPEAEFRISADGYLVTLAPLLGAVLSIEEPLGVYRLHDGNAWAMSESAAAERFRRSLQQDLSRYRALREKAAELGLEPPRDPGMRDWLHLESRICSLCVDPQGHPVLSDSRALLGWRGFNESRRDASLRWTRRVMLAAWFFLVGMLPRRLSLALVVWRMAPEARPKFLTKLLRCLRGPQRHAPRVA
jgi:peptidoglycan/LPS O-acetylase OafA/YrhL